MKKKEIPRLLASIALALLGIAFLFIVLGLSYNENLIISGVICFGSSPILFIIAGILGYKWKEELEEIHGIKWLYIIIPNLLLIVITEDHKEELKDDLTPGADAFELVYETVGVTFEFPQEQDLALSSMVLYQLTKRILQNAAVMINVSEREVDCYQNRDQQMLYFLDRSCPTGVSQQLYENLENILKRIYEVLAACQCVKGCEKCVIPFESNFLMPNVDTRDTFRKDEILALLRRFLGENGTTE